MAERNGIITPGPNIIEVDPAEVERLAAEMLSKSEIADRLGISRRTFFQRESENPQISHAFRRGRSKLKHWATNTFLKKVRETQSPALLQYLIGRLDKFDASEQDVNMSAEPKTPKDLLDDMRRMIQREVEAYMLAQCDGRTVDPEAAQVIERYAKVLLAIENGNVDLDGNKREINIRYFVASDDKSKNEEGDK